MTFDRALEFAAAKGCVIWTKRIEAERTSRLIRFAGDQEKEEMKIQLQHLAASYPHDFDLVFSCSTGFLQMKEHALAQRWLKHAVLSRLLSPHSFAPIPTRSSAPPLHCNDDRRFSYDHALRQRSASWRR